MWYFCVYQVVEGTKVMLTLELGYTTCRKEEASNVSDCQLKEDLVMLAKYIYSFLMLLLDRRGLIAFHELKMSYSK
jgi:hypothetical protein